MIYIKIRTLFLILGFLGFLGFTYSAKASYRGSPKLCLSKDEYNYLKVKLKLSKLQEKEINSLFANQWESEQQLIKLSNKLVKLLDAYSSKGEKEPRSDEYKVLLKSTKLSESEVKKKYKSVRKLVEQAIVIDNLRLEEILSESQLIMWYEHKFESFMNGILSVSQVRVAKAKLDDSIAEMVNDLLFNGKIIDQEVVDNATIELRKKIGMFPHYK